MFEKYANSCKLEITALNKAKSKTLYKSQFNLKSWLSEVLTLSVSASFVKAKVLPFCNLLRFFCFVYCIFLINFWHCFKNVCKIQSYMSWPNMSSLTFMNEPKESKIKICILTPKTPRKLKLRGLIAYIMFYKISKFESSKMTNDVIMTSLPKPMAKFSVLH